LLIISGLVLTVFAELVPYTWAWTQSEGYFKVYWVEMDYDEFTRGWCMPNEVACGRTFETKHTDGTYSTVHAIYYQKDLKFWKTNAGCTAWTHENLHHWGYNEEMIRDFFPCDRKSKYSSLPIIGFSK